MSRLSHLTNRFYDRMRHRDAYTSARKAGTARDFSHLDGHKYALLVTFRRDGTPVPTPVWFGLDDEGRLYTRTESDTAKVKRIRRDPHARVAPATVRGKPVGPVAEGQARIVPASEQEHAEQAIKSNYGVGRRLYEGAGNRLGVETVYIEVTPV
jgi:PPOX class probable F420-dependent enzyme